MSDIDQLRKRIDTLDQRLLDVLNQRARIALQIGDFKRRQGQSIFAPAREREIIQRLKALNRGPLTNEAIENLFREVVHTCRNLEKELRIAFFGQEATFTHQAALRSFGRKAQYLPSRTISDVFAQVEKGQADFGVVPIENSTEGVVNHTLDMFVDSTLTICAELELPISHYLLSRSGASLEKAGIRTLFSHYQPLAQCRKWLETHLPDVKIVESSSTSDAARQAAVTPKSAAIASRLAADLYGLEILASRIEDATNNFTRFLVIGSTEPRPTGRDKTTIMLSVKDRVGVLHDILIPFKTFKLNLTKIESRPTRQRAWEYVFFVDFHGHRDEPRVQKALKVLEKSCTFLKILGSYPRTE